MPKQTKYLFGPVPSRRLGLSLGVDIIPLKTCTQNCIYCQLGVDGIVTLKRKAYVPIDAVLAELTERVAAGLQADYITLSGSGEPTLNLQIGQIIDGIKEITDIPVAVLTNGTLFTDPAVRADCAKADIVLPSLDAGNEETFRRINRPHKNISFTSLVKGLCKFRVEFTGQIWLEVFFCDRINTDPRQIEKIKTIIERIDPDKIQLNTTVRPAVDASAIRVGPEKLKAIAEQLGEKAEVVADFSKAASTAKTQLAGRKQNILEMLKRRPCSLDDICSALGIHRNEALKYLADLEKTGKITSESPAGVLYFKKK